MLIDNARNFGKPTTASRLRIAQDGQPLSPPSNIEAEQALLGALLVDNGVLDRISSFFKPQHFFDPLHQEIFECASHLITANRKADPVSMQSFFDKAEPVNIYMTVPQYLGRLAASAVTISGAKDYARTVTDLALRRDLMVIAEDLFNGAHDAPVDFGPKQMIADAETRLFDLAEKGVHGEGFKLFNEATGSALAMALAAHARRGKITGLQTGLVDLDNKLGGLQKSDLIVLAGRPSMGKTALATNIAYNVAKSFETKTNEDGEVDHVAGAVVGFFSLEMSDEQLALRILAEVSGISGERIKKGLLDDREIEHLIHTEAAINAAPLHIDATGGITIAQLSARARKLKRQKGLGLLIVDYLQLCAGENVRGQNRVGEITQITMGLKALAKELDIPIIALSQLSRNVETRDDKRPQLSDLRESGSIEQDADVVMFVFREEYYVERAKPSETNHAEMLKWEDELAKVKGKAEAIIGKARHGPTGSVMLAFDGSLTKFSNLAPEHRAQMTQERPQAPASPPDGRPSHIIGDWKPKGSSVAQKAIDAANARRAVR